MLDPSLFGGLPHGNRTAFLDFLGTLELYHHALALAIHQTTGRSVRVLPLGTGGDRNWLEALQAQYEEEAAALGIAAPVDLRSYSLDRREDFNSWTFLLAQETNRLRAAAGVP